MGKLIIFGVLSIVVIAISWKSLVNHKSHGFYRFFSWECILWLCVSNYSYWFKNPVSIMQITSWTLLIISLYLVISGIVLIKKVGKPNNNRDEESLYNFEKTSELIDTGVFRYIRHPLYASLIILTWGIYLKNPTLWLSLIAILSTVFLYITAKLDEKECLNYFGEKYKDYMGKSKMFVPFVF